MLRWPQKTKNISSHCPQFHWMSSVFRLDFTVDVVTILFSRSYCLYSSMRKQEIRSPCILALGTHFTIAADEHFLSASYYAEPRYWHCRNQFLTTRGWILYRRNDGEHVFQEIRYEMWRSLSKFLILGVLFEINIVGMRYAGCLSVLGAL